MRARNLLALAAIATACSSQGHEPVAVGVNASFVVPEDLFTSIKSMKLSVFDNAATGADCNATTGSPVDSTGAPLDPTKTAAVLTAVLNSGAACAPAKYCGGETVNYGDLVFWAQGANSSGVEVGTGCTRATINESAEPLSIKMLRYVPPANCGDGVVQPTEQCEKPFASYCNQQTCMSNEVLLSKGSTFSGTPNSNTVTGTGGQKTSPFFLWPNNTGASGQFLALFTDKTSGATNADDIGVRALAADWTEISTPPIAASNEFFLPSGDASPQSMAGNQDAPVAVLSGSTYYVAFQDSYPTSVDIHLRSMDTSFNAAQAPNSAIVINGLGAGEAGVQGAPSIAVGSNGTMLIAWEDDSTNAGTGGTIQANTFTPPSTLGKAQLPVATGTSNTAVSVAALSPTTSSPDPRFVMVWQANTDVVSRIFDATTGTFSGAQASVVPASGTRDHPSVASLSDGSYAVVYAQHLTSTTANIMLLRYDATGAVIPNDPVVVNNISTANEAAPRIGAMTALTGSYAITWIDSATNTVRGRFAANGENGATGFLVDNVTGQDDEFQVSASGESPTNAVVVSGGASGNVIFGWQSTSAPGIVGRFFPAPTQ